MNINKEKLKNISIMATLIILILGVAYLFIDIAFNKNKVSIKKSEPNHLAYLYKGNGTISMYNIKSERYLSNTKVNDNSTYKNKNQEYQNPFKIKSYNNKMIVASPNKNELLIYNKKDNENLEQQSKVKFSQTINDFKVLNNTVAISFLNSNKVEIYDINSLKQINTLSFDKEVSSIELDNKNLYVSAGEYIHLISSDSKEKIHTGDANISLFKSSDNSLYAGNLFGEESENSVLLKLDPEKKNISSLVELNKEYPIEITENDDYIFVTCKGKLDDSLDGVVVISKIGFNIETKISTGQTPATTVALPNNEYIYVSHEDGSVKRIDIANDFNIDKEFTINNLKSLYVENI